MMAPIIDEPACHHRLVQPDAQESLLRRPVRESEDHPGAARPYFG
jgi:hypothetical protein